MRWFAWLLGSHLILLVVALVVLIFYPTSMIQKGKTLTFLLCAIILMWVIPGPMAMLFDLTSDNPVAGILVCTGGGADPPDSGCSVGLGESGQEVHFVILALEGQPQAIRTE